MPSFSRYFILLLFYLGLSIDSNSQEVKPIDVRLRMDTIDSNNATDTSKMVVKENLSMPMRIPDTLFLFNGDKITGKILSFEQGIFKFDAQGPGVISMKWHKIKTISGGNMKFKVEDNHGTMFYGLIAKSDQPGEIIIMNQIKSHVKLEGITRIFPLEAKWYRKFKGTIGAGLSYNKSSGVLQMNASYNIYYVISKWRFMNDFSYIETKNKGEDKSIRFDWNLQAYYALHGKWLLYEANVLSRNDELGIRSRISFGVGGGNSVIQTERQQLLFLSGIVQNSEKDIETNEILSNFEWPFSIRHSIYSFIRPDITSNTYVSTFIGITDKGRYRVDLNTDLTWKIVTDLSFKLSFYYSFDNKEIEGKKSKEDYGTNISLTLDLK